MLFEFQFPTSSSTAILIWMLIHHYIADFVLQSHKEASNKWHSNDALLSHVTSYTIWWWVNIFLFANWWLVILFCIITFICHFITDYFTSRHSHKYFSKQDYHNGFLVVGYDQILHYLQLWFTFKLLLLWN